MTGQAGGHEEDHEQGHEHPEDHAADSPEPGRGTTAPAPGQAVGEAAHADHPLRSGPPAGGQSPAAVAAHRRQASGRGAALALLATSLAMGGHGRAEFRNSRP